MFCACLCSLKSSAVFCLTHFHPFPRLPSTLLIDSSLISGYCPFGVGILLLLRVVKTASWVCWQSITSQARPFPQHPSFKGSASSPYLLEEKEIHTKHSVTEGGSVLMYLHKIYVPWRVKKHQQFSTLLLTKQCWGKKLYIQLQCWIH